MSASAFRTAIQGLVLLTASPLSGQSGEAAPIFFEGQAQPVEAFSNPADWIRYDLWVETDFDSDGDGAPDRVHVDVTRPLQTETEGLKVPVVYETSPYFAGVGSVAPEYFWDVAQELGALPPPRRPMPPVRTRRVRPTISSSHVAEWVPRGFAVVHSESPGTGLSQGCPTIGGTNEALAPKAVVDWLNGRARGFTAPEGGEAVTASWSTGRVGMTGTSYDGTLAIAAATTGVEGLEAIVPVSPNTSYYHYYRSNGLVRSPGGYLGEDIDVLFDFVNSGDPGRRAYCARTVREAVLTAGQDRRTGDFSDFWAERDYVPALGGLRAATLLAHGLNDWNVMPSHTVRVWEAVRASGAPAQLYLHRNGHGGAPPLELMNRWFTRYLYGVENGVESDPAAWIVREGERGGRPTAYADYPNPGAMEVLLRPTSGGTSRGGLSADSVPAQGAEALRDDVSFSGSELARSLESDHRLLYATPELRAPLHVSGTARIRVRVASDRSAANLTVWLVSLPWTDVPDPDANLVTRGWADPQNHTSQTEGEPLLPGHFYDLSFDLEPDDQIVPAGRRLGLMIFSSDPEFTLRPRPGTELTLDLDGTWLTLPVVGGEEAWSRAVDGDPPPDPPVAPEPVDSGPPRP